MSRLTRWLLGGQVEERANTLSVDQWAELLQTFSYNGVQYTLPNATQEDIGAGLQNAARGAYKANGVVFAVMMVRQLLFSEARFTYQRMRNGRPGDLWAPPPSQDLFAEL